MTTCAHKAEHKEVLGHVLCVCCSHCQKENSEQKELIKELVKVLEYETFCDETHKSTGRCGSCYLKRNEFISKAKKHLGIEK